MFHPNWEGILTGVTAWGIVGHAVNTVPTSDNVWVQWVIGIVKFGVGQRTGALNMIQGKDTLVTGVPRGMGTGSSTGSGSMEQTATTKAEVGPNSIKVTDEKTTKTETIIPKE